MVQNAARKQLNCKDPLSQSIIRSLSLIQPATPLENLEWAKVYRSNPHSAAGRKARELLLSRNLRFVCLIANKFPNCGELSDRIQSGSIGLEKAIDRFDPNRGFQFTTYAAWWIRQEILRDYQTTGHLIRVPNNLHFQHVKVAKSYSCLSVELQRSPTVAEIAAHCGYSEALVTRVIYARSFLIETNTITLDTQIGIDPSDTLASVLADPKADPFGDTRKAIVKSAISEIMEKELSPIESQLVRIRFGFVPGTKKTMNEIAQELRLTVDQLKKIQTCALKKIKEQLIAQNTDLTIFDD